MGQFEAGGFKCLFTVQGVRRRGFGSESYRVKCFIICGSEEVEYSVLSDHIYSYHNMPQNAMVEAPILELRFAGLGVEHLKAIGAGVRLCVCVRA